MKGNAEVLEKLNEALSSELTAINQYVIHARMRFDWGYKKLAQISQKESIEEMHHAQNLIDRILFLEGIPNMQKYKIVQVGKDIPEQMKFELQAEREAVAEYNASIALCRAKGDNGTAELFETLLADEEHHVDELESQLHLMETMGLQNYLAQGMGEPGGK